MNAHGRDPDVWTRDRFLGLVAVLFVLQIGLILLFAARVAPASRASTPAVRFRASSGAVSENELLRAFFVGEPDIFLTPNAHGFSGRAWMNQPRQEYRPPNRLQGPVWLSFSPARLGAILSDSNQSNALLPTVLADQGTPEAEPLPVFLPPQILSTQSVFSLEGGVATRLAGAPPALRSWPSSDLLTNSVVQIAVSPAGEVIAARLQTRSGSGDADAAALAQARTLRFRPSSVPGIKWASAVFQWRTDAATNVVPQK